MVLLGAGCRHSSSGNDLSRQRASSAPNGALPATPSTYSSLSGTSHSGRGTAGLVARSVPNIAVSSSGVALGDAPIAGPSLIDLPHYSPNIESPTSKRPLLLFLHGFGADGALSFRVLGLGELGQKYQIFVVAPNGTLDSQRRRFWNAHPACCNFGTDKVDHVRYLSTLVDEMLAKYPVDASKVYVAGFSNGGFMAHRLACEWGERLRGIVSVAGAGPYPSVACKAAKNLRVLEIHGDADPTVFYTGGTLFDRKGATYGSAMQTFEGWGKRLGCAGAPVSDGLVDFDPVLPGEETSVLTYRGCARGITSLWTVRGGAHLIGNRPSAMEKAWLFLDAGSD